jgi:hypothetical protein
MLADDPARVLPQLAEDTGDVPARRRCGEAHPHSPCQPTEQPGPYREAAALISPHRHPLDPCRLLQLHWPCPPARPRPGGRTARLGVDPRTWPAGPNPTTPTSPKPSARTASSCSTGRCSNEPVDNPVDDVRAARVALARWRCPAMPAWPGSSPSTARSAPRAQLRGYHRPAQSGIGSLRRDAAREAARAGARWLSPKTSSGPPASPRTAHARRAPHRNSGAPDGCGAPHVLVTSAIS